MHGIGAQLRAAREAREISLELAEEETKIRKKYLLALEDDTPEVIPGDVYARGFLRTYANWLGLDGAQLLEQYKERQSQSSPPVSPNTGEQVASVAVQSVAASSSPKPVAVPPRAPKQPKQAKRKDRHKPGLGGMPILVACAIVAVAFAGYLLIRSLGHQSATPPPDTTTGANETTNGPAEGTGGTSGGDGANPGNVEGPGNTATGTPASTESPTKVTMNQPKGESVVFDVSGADPIDVTLEFDSKQAVYMRVTVDGKVVAEQNTTDPGKTHWTGKSIAIRLGHAETLKAIKVNGETFERPLRGGPFTLTFAPHA